MAWRLARGIARTRSLILHRAGRSAEAPDLLRASIAEGTASLGDDDERVADLRATLADVEASGHG